MKIKKFIIKFFRFIGLNISRYYPSSSPEAQLNKVLELLKINVVFDIGANEGQFGCNIRNFGFGGKIVSFEPLTSARTKLMSLAEREKNWVIHKQCALGNKNGEIEINIAKNSVSSSILPMLKSHLNADNESVYVGTERIPIERLDSIASHYFNDDSNLFIKIDTQGYEKEVLDGAKETLKSAKGILCELSLTLLYEGQYLWRDIIKRLDEEGFVIWTLQKGFTNPRTGQTLQIDAIFLRRDQIKKEI